MNDEVDDLVPPVLVEAFRFTSHAEWVRTAPSMPWTWTRLSDGSKFTTEICADAKGRVCRIGRDFQIAHDEGTFPVVAYRIQSAPPAAPPVGATWQADVDPALSPLAQAAEALRQKGEQEKREQAARAAFKAGKASVRVGEAERLMSVPEQVARLAHRGQVDKAGRPYIEHVERVVARVRGDALAEAVAWLHDVVEDTMFTEDTLAAFVDDPDVRGAVSLLTRDKTFQSYEDYIEGIRASGDPLALKVKLADLHDHLDNPGCPATLRPRYEAALAALAALASPAPQPAAPAPVEQPPAERCLACGGPHLRCECCTTPGF
jgi:hypothetical protein